MLEYFIRNRRGSITVMLSIILIAALSLNSTLIEIAKYHSMERLYKEMSENAAVSLLSHYDRDLYENFGFLALEYDVGEKELMQYLQMNLAGLSSGLPLNRADILANVTSDDVDVERLYPLSQKDVYVAQMMEFGAYRAPTSLVSDALDIEGMLKELMKELEKALPILKLFEQLSGIIEAYVKTVICLHEYLEATVKLKKEVMVDYLLKLYSYDAAVAEMNDFISDYDGERDENYESKLQALKDSAAENAAELQKYITVDLIPALEDYSEKMDDYITAYDEFLHTDAKAIFAALDMDLKQEINDAKKANEETASLETTKNFIGMIKDNMGEGQGLFDDIFNEIEQLPANMMEDAQKKLEEQAAKLGVPPENLELLDLVEEVDPDESMLAVLLNNIMEFGEVLAEMVEGLAKAIATIVKGVGAVALAFTATPFDLDMTNTMRNTVYLTPASSSSHAEEDDAAVKAMLMDSAEIAKYTDYNAGQLAPGKSWEESAFEDTMSNLEGAMAKLYEAEEIFRTACGDLKSDRFNPVGMLQSLIALVGAVKNFVVSIINLITLFLQSPLDVLMKVIYQKLFATVYATGMFSNRVTDMDSDKRLNGSSFFTKSDYYDPGGCFVQADAEYIYCGYPNEIDNQVGAFFSILLFRMLCNITSVLTDEELLAFISEMAAIPIVGWIVIIVVVLLKLILEAWFDMIQMIYAKEDVDFLKLDGGYFALNGQGVDELEDMVRAVIKEQTGITVEKKKNDMDKIEDKKQAEGANENEEVSVKWSYKDHLFLMMLLFTSKNKIYERSATLIETQLQQKKYKDDSSYVFRLVDMATYIRVDTVAEYQPLLPVPVIPGLNDTGIKIRTVHYSGY